MDQQQLQEQLQQLEQQKLQYSHLLNAGPFNSLEEGEAFIEANQKELIALRHLVMEIDSIRWDLLTEEERLKAIEFARLQGSEIKTVLK